MRRTLLSLPILLALLAAAAPAATAQEPPPEPVIRAGVTVAGLDVGGQTLSQAAARIQAAFGSQLARNVSVRVAGRGYRLRMKQLGFVFDPLKSARRANIFGQRSPGTEPVDVPVWVRYRHTAVRAFAGRVAATSRIAPRNARVHMSLRRMYKRPSRSGRQIDASRLRSAVEAAVEDPAARRALSAVRRRVPAAVRIRDLKRIYGTVITVDRAHFRLRLFKRLQLSKFYGVAVGMPAYPTPTGRFSITNKAVNPAWSAPNRPWAGAYANETVPGGSAENPLKARWMGVTNGVGIHGTGSPWSIGTRASHGCIRMTVSDVIDLYPRVPVGTPVLIR